MTLQVAIVLSNLEGFFQEVEPKVEAISGEESDTQAFMNLMSIFNQVMGKGGLSGRKVTYHQ
jgi:hypothetical protein